MHMTTNGGRVLLGIVTAFMTMAGFLLGFAVGSFLVPAAADQPNWIALGLGVALCSVGAMVGAGFIEYLRRAPFLPRVMAAAGIAGFLLPFGVLSVVPSQFAFPVLAFLVGGCAVWVDVRQSRRTGWEG